ncbi:MAG TPA: PilN domain-containing protein [Nitrospiraceae bacterium]|nr:PilN domain-containing protein [Nitrospiraceae bacterium]
MPSILGGRMSLFPKWFRKRSYFHIELSSRYRWYLAPLRLVLMTTCGVLGVMMMWDLVQTSMTYQEAYAIQARITHVQEQDQQVLVEAKSQEIDLSESSLQRLPAEVALANQLLAKRHFSWTQFLSGLEEVIPPRVAIESVRLDPGSAVIHLTGSAVSLEDITALTVKLQDHQIFRDPVLGQHRAGSTGLVEFDLMLKYRPAQGI